MREKKEEKVEYHKIIITQRYNAIPERYFVSIHCGLLYKDNPLAEFSNFPEAKKYGEKKARELGLKLENEGRERKAIKKKRRQSLR